MEYKEEILHDVIRRIFLEWRQKHGLTQKHLSIKTNLTRQFISQIEGGKRQPSLITLSAMLKAYERSLSLFFQEVDKLYSSVESEIISMHTNNIAAESNKNAKSYINTIKQNSNY